MKYTYSRSSATRAAGKTSRPRRRGEHGAWNRFEREVVDAGVSSAGEGLQPSNTATSIKVGEGTDRMVTDGPFAETKEQLGGFYLIECGNLDQALEWAKKVPLFAWRDHRGAARHGLRAVRLRAGRGRVEAAS